MSRIYFDNNATTALHPRVLHAMLQDFEGGPLNPSSVHGSGRDARNLLTKARRSVATFFGVLASELLFTSGATEALNTVLSPFLCRGGHVITSNVEHPSVLAPLEQYAERGGPVTFLSAGLWGAVQPSQVQAALRPSTRLITLMAVNNETGVMTNLEGVAAVAREAGVPFVVDGVAWLGKEEVRIPEGVSAICFSGHKVHAPKGVGLAVVRRSLRIAPLLLGGGQEQGRRGGTENLAGILGFAEALRLITEEGGFERMRTLRKHLYEQLAVSCDCIVNGEGPKVSNTLNVSFPGLEAESLLILLDIAGVEVSHGSACASGSMEVSRILRSMGVPESEAAASLRFSLCRYTTEEEVDRAVSAVCQAVNSLRERLTIRAARP